MGISRQGMAHQAGSDAWVTGKAFFNLLKHHFQGTDQEFDWEYSNWIFGIGESKNDEYYMKEYWNRTRKNQKKSKMSDEMSDYVDQTQDSSWDGYYPEQHPYNIYPDWNPGYTHHYQGFPSTYTGYHGQPEYPYEQ